MVPRQASLVGYGSQLRERHAAVGPVQPTRGSQYLAVDCCGGGHRARRSRADRQGTLGYRKISCQDASIYEYGTEHRRCGTALNSQNVTDHHRYRLNTQNLRTLPTTQPPLLYNLDQGTWGMPARPTAPRREGGGTIHIIYGDHSYHRHVCACICVCMCMYVHVYMYETYTTLIHACILRHIQVTTLVCIQHDIQVY